MAAAKISGRRIRAHHTWEDIRMTALKDLRLIGAGTAGLMALALAISAATPASAACKNRGNLDTRYCDDNGDLVADVPTDKSEWLDPSTLIFSYTPVEDPSVYENVLTEFVAAAPSRRIIPTRAPPPGSRTRVTGSRRVRPTGPDHAACNVAAAGQPLRAGSPDMPPGRPSSGSAEASGRFRSR